MVSQDPEQRIAELEEELAQTKHIAELERELAAARAAEQGGEGPSAQWFRPDAVEAAAPADTRLADPPRRLPVSFLLAELLPFRWWYIWTMFMVAVAPIVVWINTPAAVAPAAVLTLLAIYALQARGAITRRALLKWARWQPSRVAKPFPAERITAVPRGTTPCSR
jgi:cell division septum initiation protein DivIVA